MKRIFFLTFLFGALSVQAQRNELFNLLEQGEHDIKLSVDYLYAGSANNQSPNENPQFTVSLLADRGKIHIDSNIIEFKYIKFGSHSLGVIKRGKLMQESSEITFAGPKISSRLRHGNKDRTLLDTLFRRKSEVENLAKETGVRVLLKEDNLRHATVILFDEISEEESSIRKCRQSNELLSYQTNHEVCVTLSLIKR
jgi:hypothetical protein